MREGKRILITGASGGIGSAIAVRLAEEGNHIVLHGWRNNEALLHLQEMVLSKGSTCELWLYDFMRGMDESTIQAQASLNHIDVFIHASGHGLYRMFMDTTETEWDDVFNVHVKSAFLITKRILPHMVRNQWGRIVLISSIWGEAGASCEVAYASAKGALNAFTRSLAKELAPSGITVNAVAPGAIETKMVLDYLSPEELEALRAEIPSGRLGYPTEVANLIEFVTKEENSYITGQILHINGGWR